MTLDERLELIAILQPELLKLGCMHEAAWIADHIRDANLPSQTARITRANEIISRRKNDEPLAYIFDEWAFKDHEFYCGPGTLIPRPETEEMCEAALQAFENSMSSSERALVHGITILDLGAGTGCLGLSFLADLIRDIRIEKGAEASEISSKLKLVLVEKSSAALPYIRRNIERIRPKLENATVEIFEGSWSDWPIQDSHVLLSNPPYLSESEYSQIDRSVSAFEPKSALVPENGGRGEIATESYAEILKIAQKSLVSGGWIWMELGTNQHLWLQDYAVSLGGFNDLRTIKDLSRKPRFFCARKH